LDLLNRVLIHLPAALICITVHEFAHGYVAYLMGDQTARLSGRLTLNPLYHIDPAGLLCMVFFRFGWAKPVPVNIQNFRWKKYGIFLVSFAGPLSNVLLAFVLVLAARLLAPVDQWFVTAFIDFLVTVAQLSIGLALFNLLPIPPLDGSKMLLPFLPARAMAAVLRYERYSIIILILLLYLNILTVPLGIAYSAIWNGVIRLTAAALSPFGL